MKRVLFLLLLGAALAAQAGPGAHGPNGEHLDAPGAPAATGGLARLPDGSVNVPKAAQRRMGVRTLLAPQTQAAATLELPGRVTINPNAGGRVQPMHGGRIEAGPQGLPVAGQRVRRGQVLAYVRHHADPSTRSALQAQLAELRAQRQVADARATRLEGLEGSVARKDIEAARAEAQGLAERERTLAVGLVAREALVAPVDGVVARAEAIVGQVVEARDLLFEIVDPTRLLVEATTADPTLARRIGGASLAGEPGAQLRLLGAAQALRDGVLPLLFAVERARQSGTTPRAAAPALALGQPVTVVVRLSERIDGIVLPASAVVRGVANEQVVWIKSGAERFIAQPVQVRPLDASTVVVTQGLGADNRVVVQGASLIAQIR